MNIEDSADRVADGLTFQEGGPVRVFQLLGAQTPQPPSEGLLQGVRDKSPSVS